MGKTYHSISDIVASVYCEQKMLFDRTRGSADPVSVRVRAAGGKLEHARFEVEGKTHAALDRRCFIASALYGPESDEVAFLRQWRDEVLIPSVLGRWVVRFYYALSPCLVKVLIRSRFLASMVRYAIDHLLRRLGMPR